MYVVIGQHVIKHRTLLNAVDACFKMFYVLDVSYLDRCVSVWEFFISVELVQLAGGTAGDYHEHISDSINSLAKTYSNFHDDSYQSARTKIISNISNTLTDRCAANHATIQLLNEIWDKTLNELNCHLHPLDTIATKTLLWSDTLIWL